MVCVRHTAKADTHMESIGLLQHLRLHLHLHLHLRSRSFVGHHLRNGNSDGSNDDAKMVTVMVEISPGDPFR